MVDRVEMNANEVPRISVCMAAYQGERYIAAQLLSILTQLSVDDEVIVVDDHSSDRTREEVLSLNDGRIHLFEHGKNQGVAQTFQDALARATGRFIFLSDQDDIWAPTKVATVLQTFEMNPNATLVVTDATLIDEEGKRLGTSYYSLRGRFRSGIFSNLIRCKFLGCLMAFRSELVPKILPFPDGCGDVLHDFWIGAINSVTAGMTYYVDEPLVWYRRHQEAVTRRDLALRRKISIRLNLIRALTSFWARNQVARWVGT